MAHERFPPDLLVQPASHRLAYFRSYTVAHPVLQAVDSAVKRALREPAGGSLVLVMGPTGVGKTTLRLRIEQHLRNTFVSAAKEDPGRIPVIGVEAAAPDSGNFNWKDYYRRALLAVEEPLTDFKIAYGSAGVLATQTGRYAVVRRGEGSELRYALEQALRHRRPAAVLIDEAQHLTKIASGRKLADQLDCLKSFASLTGCVHVLIGTYELLPFRNLSAQLSRRSIDIHFRRYHARDPEDAAAFQRIVYSFQRHLPLVEEPELWRDWDYYYTYSVGCIGLLKDWLTRALATALEEGSKTLTRQHLEQHAWSLDQCHKMAQDAIEGEAALTPTAESSIRLRQLLGFAEPHVSGQHAEAPVSHTLPALGAKSQPTQRRRRRTGERRPKRDPIGKACDAE
jgi:energy-coupling factor transporter ATP-binding protein EcfA2